MAFSYIFSGIFFTNIKQCINVKTIHHHIIKIKGYNTLSVIKPSKVHTKRLVASYKAGTKNTFLEYRNFGNESPY